MAALEKAFSQRSALPPRDIRVTKFGDRVQEAGAGIVSLSALYADPISSMRRAQRRSLSRAMSHLALPEATA
jgi:hypothetical protein